jgi:hypothetical protein
MKCPIYVTTQTVAFSGATLLAFLLGAHPQISTVGEMNGRKKKKGLDVDTYLCSCGQKIKECEFWQSVKTAMQARGFEFDPVHFDTRFILSGPPIVQTLRHGSFRNSTLDSMRDAIFHIWPPERREIKRLVARNEALIEAVLSLTGNNVFVDTSKEGLRLRSFRRFSAFDMRVIHLIRDVRGVVASHLRRKRARSMSEAVRHWVKKHQKIQRDMAAWSDVECITVRYEDLCQDTQSTLERLYRFCGVDPHIQITDFRAIPQHIGGNSMRLRSGSEIKLDERWKQQLAAEQLKEIDRVAGKLNRQYGYD